MLAYLGFLKLNGSSGGARPKIQASINPNNYAINKGRTENWIIKFPATQHDPDDIGAIEYSYSLMAKEAGIEMETTHLFKSKSNPGFFGTRRFDFQNNSALHIHTVCGLL